MLGDNGTCIQIKKTDHFSRETPDPCLLLVGKICFKKLIHKNLFGLALNPKHQTDLESIPLGI